MRSKLFRVSAGIALSLFLSGFCQPNDSRAAEFVSVIGDNINVRSGPGTNYQVAMELFDGYPLQVVDKQGEWLKVSDFENDTGWIHSSLVQQAKTVIVNASSYVNMRAEASTSSRVVATVERGVVLTVLENKGEWMKLRHSGGPEGMIEGWIHKSLLWP